jgi:hypothetical protein
MTITAGRPVSPPASRAKFSRREPPSLALLRMELGPIRRPRASGPETGCRPQLATAAGDVARLRVLPVDEVSGAVGHLREDRREVPVASSQSWFQPVGTFGREPADDAGDQTLACRTPRSR